MYVILVGIHVALMSNNNNNNNNIIIIIISSSSISINCNWAVIRWQWLFYMYTEYEIGYC